MIRFILAAVAIVALLLGLLPLGALKLGAPSSVDLVLSGIAILVFVAAAAGSAILDYLVRLRREAEKQTALLEEIARNTRPPGAADKPESAVAYRIPGING